MSTTSCWNTTRRAPATSRHCVLCRRDKGVVLGLISSKVPELEELDELKRRVHEAARYIDLDRLAISPQCGFASAAVGNPVTEGDERAKLRLTVELAGAIWS